jgi:hypothetical protein
MNDDTGKTVSATSATRARRTATRRLAERSTEAARQLADDGAETAQRAAEAATQTSQRVAETVTRQAAQAGAAALGAAEIAAGAAQRTTRDLAPLARLPAVAADGLQATSRVWLDAVARATQISTRLPQDLLRCTSPQDVVLVQSMFLRDLVANALETASALFQVSSQLSQQTRQTPEPG